MQLIQAILQLEIKDELTFLERGSKLTKILICEQIDVHFVFKKRLFMNISVNRRVRNFKNSFAIYSKTQIHL